MSSQDFSSHTAATASSDYNKIGVLSKWITTREVVVPLPTGTVWVQISRGAYFFGRGIIKILFHRLHCDS